MFSIAQNFQEVKYTCKHGRKFENHRDVLTVSATCETNNQWTTPDWTDYICVDSKWTYSN